MIQTARINTKIKNNYDLTRKFLNETEGFT